MLLLLHSYACRLTGCGLGSDEAKLIGELLGLQPYLTSLDLSNNSIGPEGATAVATGLRTNYTLRDLQYVALRSHPLL